MTVSGNTQPPWTPKTWMLISKGGKESAVPMSVVANSRGAHARGGKAFLEYQPRPSPV